VRLTVELRQRKTELEELTAALRASRDRLLTARAVEQQRMRAEVATRLGTHLSAALTAIDDAQATPGNGSMATVAQEAELALDELRVIARGIYPPTLAEVGLAASLESWLARTSVTATLDIADDLASSPDPDTVACLYFCAVTSMSHLAHHRASAIRVGVAAGPVLSIGASVPAPVAAETIEAVTDRIEAFGGRVHSRLDEHEFTLTATLPARVGAAS
jgi:signal transduction histidine kinase